MTKNTNPAILRAGITPLFNLGEVSISALTRKEMQKFSLNPQPFLKRHQRGDWGRIYEENAQANDRRAVDQRGIIVSAYEFATVGISIMVSTVLDSGSKTTLDICKHDKEADNKTSLFDPLPGLIENFSEAWLELKNRVLGNARRLV